MSSGWVGPGAKSSPQNESELGTYKALKRRFEHEERDRLAAENERRASVGLKPGKNPSSIFSPLISGERRGKGSVSQPKESRWDCLLFYIWAKIDVIGCREGTAWASCQETLETDDWMIL